MNILHLIYLFFYFFIDGYFIYIVSFFLAIIKWAQMNTVYLLYCVHVQRAIFSL